MKNNVAIIACLVLFAVLASCTTQNVGADLSDDLRIVSGKPVGNIHELHDGPDEDGNRFAQCLDCHKSHGMTFDWHNVDREYCYTCHPDYVNHKVGKDCMKCHDNSNGPGNN